MGRKTVDKDLGSCQDEVEKEKPWDFVFWARGERSRQGGQWNFVSNSLTIRMLSVNARCPECQEKQKSDCGLCPKLRNRRKGKKQVILSLITWTDLVAREIQHTFLLIPDREPTVYQVEQSYEHYTWPSQWAPWLTRTMATTNEHIHDQQSDYYSPSQ